MSFIAHATLLTSNQRSIIQMMAETLILLRKSWSKERRTLLLNISIIETGLGWFNRYLTDNHSGLYTTNFLTMNCMLLCIGASFLGNYFASIKFRNFYGYRHIRQAWVRTFLATATTSSIFLYYFHPIYQTPNK